MARPKIGIDMDGVLANFVDVFKHEAQEVLGRKLEGPSVDWGFSNWMTEQEQTKVWNKIRNTENWFLYYPEPLPGVERLLSKLDKLAELYFVTTRIETKGLPVNIQTCEWLAPYLEFPTVIVTKDKGLVANALNLKYFIDDKPENLEDIRTHSPSTKVFLQDASYNKRSSLTRVMNFQDFYDRVI